MDMRVRVENGARIVEPLPIYAERETMRLNFSQFALKAVEFGWITEAEGLAFARRQSLPAFAQAAIDAMPDPAAAEIQIWGAPWITRNHPLLAVMQAAAAGAGVSISDEEVDQAFRDGALL